jgi:hypothetical protein
VSRDPRVGPGETNCEDFLLSTVAIAIRAQEVVDTATISKTNYRGYFGRPKDLQAPVHYRVIVLLVLAIPPQWRHMSWLPGTRVVYTWCCS